jgi:hypothetical protein
VRARFRVARATAPPSLPRHGWRHEVTGLSSLNVIAGIWLILAQWGAPASVCTRMPDTAREGRRARPGGRFTPCAKATGRRTAPVWPSAGAMTCAGS